MALLYTDLPCLLLFSYRLTDRYKRLMVWGGVPRLQLRLGHYLGIVMSLSFERMGAIGRFTIKLNIEVILVLVWPWSLELLGQLEWNPHSGCMGHKWAVKMGVKRCSRSVGIASIVLFSL
jgi:hypothetical protein